ncbi:hypothetical protein SAMN04244547_02171 [Azotobacter vinelandii]|nr:hypothetical protein SAMN04244547_02171 [Azotobacter vinelandii]
MALAQVIRRGGAAVVFTHVPFREAACSETDSGRIDTDREFPAQRPGNGFDRWFFFLLS